MKATAPIAVACPKCEATAGMSCRRRQSSGPRSGESLAGFHDERKAAAWRVSLAGDQP